MAGEMILRRNGFGMMILGQAVSREVIITTRLSFKYNRLERLS